MGREHGINNWLIGWLNVFIFAVRFQQGQADKVIDHFDFFPMLYITTYVFVQLYGGLFFALFLLFSYF